MSTRVMVFPGAHNLPLWLMDNLAICYTKSRDEQIDTLQHGRVDIIHTSPDNLFLPDAAGLQPFLSGTVGPLELVATQKDGPHVLAVDNPHSGFGRLAYNWLRQHAPNLTYTILPAGGTPQRLEALQSARATLAVMHPPFSQFCQANGYTVLGRIDTGYPTLCGVSREDSATSELLKTYRWNYREALAKLSTPQGTLLAREAFAGNLPDLPEHIRNPIADLMRVEVIAAGVDFHPADLQKLRALPFA